MQPKKDIWKSFSKTFCLIVYLGLNVDFCSVYFIECSEIFKIFEANLFSNQLALIL